MMRKTLSVSVSNFPKNLTFQGDAFVAFGGNPDLTGVVDLTQMRNLIETEFKLEVNVQVKN